MSKHTTDHMMTVAHLIQYLEKLDPEAFVILSSDSEGNGFSPITEEHGEGYYAPDSTWSGEWVTEEEKDEYDSEDLLKAIFLFPVN